MGLPNPAAQRRGTIAPVRVDPTGLAGPTRHQATTAAWRRTSRGYYVPADLARTPLQRVAEAGVLTRTPQVAVTGWAALCWLGARWVTGTSADGSTWPVDLAAAGAALRPQRGLRISQERVDRGLVRIVDGVRVVDPVTAVVFAARRSPTRDGAVELLDMACAADLVSLAEVAARLEQHPGLRGVSRVREALPLADENAWSPREVHTRLAWERLTGNRPLTNRPVFTPEGRLIGAPDLLDPVTGVCCEYDGDHHLDRRQRRRDLAREDEFRAHGLEPFVLVAGDLASGRLAHRLAAATARAGLVPADSRRWTLDTPPWWEPAHTVSRRRDLRRGNRLGWLRRGA